MDWFDDNELDSKVDQNKKLKKSVMIDDKTKIKFINIESAPSKPSKPFLANVDVNIWPWRIGSSVFLIGYLFHVLAFATPFWMVLCDANGDDVMTAGMWCSCASINDCGFRNETSTCIDSVRTFGGFGIICGSVVIIMLGCHIKKPQSRSCLNRAIVTNCFVAALSVQISTSVFWRSIGCGISDIVKVSTTSHRWAWSLALSYTAVLFLVVAGLVFLIIDLIVISRRRGTGTRPWNGRGFVIT